MDLTYIKGDSHSIPRVDLRNKVLSLIVTFGYVWSYASFRHIGTFQYRIPMAYLLSNAEPS